MITLTESLGTIQKERLVFQQFSEDTESTPATRHTVHTITVYLYIACSTLCYRLQPDQFITASSCLPTPHSSSPKSHCHKCD